MDEEDDDDLLELDAEDFDGAGDVGDEDDLVGGSVRDVDEDELEDDLDGVSLRDVEEEDVEVDLSA